MRANGEQKEDVGDCQLTHGQKRVYVSAMDGSPPLDTLVLCILDGWGIGKGDAVATGDAIRLASKIGKTPNWDRLCKESLMSQLQTSGESVGLPKGQMGNSEVGHLHIGAGRVVQQSLTRIDEAIASGEFFRNEGLNEFAEATTAVKKEGSVVHVAGIVSSGGVHGSAEHVLATLKFFHGKGLDVRLHAFLDGRDTPPCAALEELPRFLDRCEKEGLRKDLLATIIGRYYAMDRDNRWERTELAIHAMAFGIRASNAEEYIDGSRQSVEEALKKRYARDESDEFVKPLVCDGYEGFAEEDALFFTNFRDDRMLQLAMFCTEDDLTKSKYFYLLDVPRLMGSMMPYHERRKGFKDFYVAFDKEPVEDSLGEVVSKSGLKQLRIAETEKYPHVTYFFNCGHEKKFEGEEYILVDSPKIATYDLQPEMSADRLTIFFLTYFLRKDISLFVLNFANPDMVGHTGRLPKAVEAIEDVDRCLGLLVDKVKESSKKAGVMIFADHGNAEQMIDKNGKPHTAHTTNPVPLVVTGSPSAKLNKDCFNISNGSLIDIAPTALYLLGLEQPAVMTGRSLLTKKS